MKPNNNRKIEHLRICLKESVEGGLTGFDRIYLKHEALPEVDYSEIDLTTKLFGKKLNYPIIIEALTGGAAQSKKINADLAKVAQDLKIGFSVGSQRPALEDKRLEDTYRIQEIAPDILRIANLGAVQLNYGYGLSECKKAVDMISADALALHLNPLQEVIQPEGNKNFRGLADRINSLTKALPTPIIAKEVGSGISYETAKKLSVAAYDVGGAGGTNWALVESLRSGNKKLGEVFSSWGIPTAESVAEVASLGKPVIASGGVRSGLDAAKAFALGASCVGVALPVLKAWQLGGAEEVRAYLNQFVEELLITMFLTGSKNLRELCGKIRAHG